jgi:hypothetical protein
LPSPVELAGARLAQLAGLIEPDHHPRRRKGARPAEGTP